MHREDESLVAAPPTLAVDVRRAAEMIGANESDVRGWIASGRLPCVRYPSTRNPGEPSRRILIAVSDLEEFVRQHRGASPEPNVALSRAAVDRWRKSDVRQKPRADVNQLTDRD